ncbi:MAG: hydroxymethylglutaryl-CoA synthase family protein [Actinobacteria bacterium]|nr:hydroxymethylglutaryl-CoA synthase family protein [Actinomycetota bacterium]
MGAAILACGGAAPDWRVDAGGVRAAWGGPARAAESGKQAKGRIAVCAPDEDTLTLAWEAGSRAVAAAGLDPDAIDGLWWGTTRPPFAEGPSHAYLASALGLRPSARGALLSGSTHSGVDALLAAADAVTAGSVSTALVVASDALVPGLGTAFEARCGAGAAAFLLSASGPATLGPVATHSRPVVDRYRGDGEEATRDLYDARLFREEVFVPEIVEIAGSLEMPDDTRWSLPDPDGRMAAAACRRLGGELASASVFEALGDSGAAAPFLGLVATLTSPGPAGVVAYGGGRTTAVAVDVGGPLSDVADLAFLVGGREVSYAEALRSRRQLVPSGETVEMGLPPGGAAFVRGNPEMLGLLGGRCVDCGTISTPPSIHPHCVSCGGPKLEPVALARTGTVHTYVVNHTMPAPFEAPLALAVLDLDDGARLMVQATSPEGVEIGADVELVLRRYALERGVPVYGFKARPKPTTRIAG